MYYVALRETTDLDVATVWRTAGDAAVIPMRISAIEDHRNGHRLLRMVYDPDSALARM